MPFGGIKRSVEPDHFVQRNRPCHAALDELVIACLEILVLVQLPGGKHREAQVGEEADEQKGDQPSRLEHAREPFHLPNSNRAGCPITLRITTATGAGCTGLSENWADRGARTSFTTCPVPWWSVISVVRFSTSRRSNMLAIEHRAQRRACSCGVVTTAAFPAEARAPVCYGPGVAALGAYLLGRQHLPVDRRSAEFGGSEAIPGCSQRCALHGHVEV